MNLAILFWCYKDVAICTDRLGHLRRLNPQISIFVLFGGEAADSPDFEACLGPYVDDFYVFDEGPPAGVEVESKKFRGGERWKYVFGDLLFAGWYRQRGQHLEWDTVVVVQWDMLLFAPVNKIFSGLQEGQILFSGLRPVSEVAETWSWVSPELPEANRMYHRFLNHVRDAYEYDDEPLCFVAIVLCLPRAFLDKFARIERPELGFIEYRLPIYAQIFGTPICREHAIRPWWGATDRYTVRSTLRALPFEIWVPTMALNLLRPNGARIFHPFWRPTPSGFTGWVSAFFNGLWRAVIALVRGLPVC